MAEKLMPALLRAYAKELGANFRSETTGEARTRVITLTGEDDTIKAQVTLSVVPDDEAYAAMVKRDADVVLPSARMGRQGSRDPGRR